MVILHLNHSRQENKHYNNNPWRLRTPLPLTKYICIVPSASCNVKQREKTYLGALCTGSNIISMGALRLDPTVINSGPYSCRDILTNCSTDGGQYTQRWIMWYDRITSPLNNISWFWTTSPYSYLVDPYLPRFLTLCTRYFCRLNIFFFFLILCLFFFFLFFSPSWTSVLFMGVEASTPQIFSTFSFSWISWIIGID